MTNSLKMLLRHRLHKTVLWKRSFWKVQFNVIMYIFLVLHTTDLNVFCFFCIWAVQLLMVCFVKGFFRVSQISFFSPFHQRKIICLTIFRCGLVWHFHVQYEYCNLGTLSLLWDIVPKKLVNIRSSSNFSEISCCFDIQTNNLLNANVLGWVFG